MSLPAAWVNRVFEKLTLVYGQPFLKRWEGLDLEKVKADWAHELRGFAANPDAIKHGLKHLPADFPPTVLEFVKACQRAPVNFPPALPAPKASAEAVSQAKAYGIKLGSDRDPQQWARELEDREKAGGRLTAAQRVMWRKTLAKQPQSSEAA